MKLNFSLLAILFVIGSFTLSCNSDDDNNSGSSYFLKAKVDGVNFESFGDLTSGEFTESNSFGTVLQIGGVSEESANISTAIGLAIMGYEGPGTYMLSPDSTYGAEFTETILDLSNPMNSELKQWVADPELGGYIKIEEETSTTISGSFEFTVRFNDLGGTVPDEPNKHITNGSFHVKLD